jgi:hypothetical protein
LKQIASDAFGLDSTLQLSDQEEQPSDDCPIPCCRSCGFWALLSRMAVTLGLDQQEVMFSRKARTENLPFCLGHGSSFTGLKLWRPSRTQREHSLSTAFPGGKYQIEANAPGSYAAVAVNGVPTTQRNGRSVLGVWEEDWKFANNICERLNSFDDDPELFLTEDDRKWLKAMDCAFGRKVHHV